MCLIMEFLSCFFFKMKLSSAVMILGIISLSSANRIPPHQSSCVTYCGNYAKHCDLQLDCPLEFCEIGDGDCFLKCMTYFGCYIQRKREKSDAIVETIWGSKVIIETEHAGLLLIDERVFSLKDDNWKSVVPSLCMMQSGNVIAILLCYEKLNLRMAEIRINTVNHIK